MAVITPSLGILLNQLFDRVDQTIDAAKNAGLQLEMEAGAQVRLTIENARIAYADSLNLTMDRVDQTARNTFDQISTLVGNVESKSSALLKQATATAQQIANTLPLHNNRPQVTTLVPKYIVNQTPIHFKFMGNFQHASEPNYQPNLKFGTRTFQASRITTQSLEFTANPSEVFEGVNLQTITKIAYSQGILSTPWPATLMGTNEAKFTVLIGALPSSPGTITLEYTTQRTERQTQVYTSQNMHLASTREAGNNDQIGHLFRAYPTPGWHVVRGSSSTSVTHHGECQLPSFESDHDDVVVYKGSTIHKVKGSSGSMDVTISFTEYQDVSVTDHHSEKINLKWGDSKVFNHPLGTWKITFNAFDGSSHEFLGSDLTSSDYIKIENQGGGFVIKATKPKDLEDI